MTSRAIIAAFALSLVSCAAADRTPTWVTRGSGVFVEGGQPALYGVGRDEAAARAELAKLADGVAPVFAAGFMAASKSKGEERVDEEQHMGQTIKNIFKFTKNFAVIADRWTDAAGTPYVLGRIDSNAVLLTIEDSRELDPKALHYVHDHVRQEFSKRAAQFKR